MTNQDVRDYVDNESLGYAVQFGLTSERFQDKKLTTLWEATAQAMFELDEYLLTNTVGECD